MDARGVGDESGGSACTGGGPYQLIDAEDGSLIGTMDSAQAMTQGHPGAIYIHQNAQYLVESLDEAARVILLSRVYPDYYTRAIEATEVKILQEKAGVRYEFDGAPARYCWSDDAPRAGSGDRSGYGLSTVFGVRQ